jgi:hypothetical protein
MHTSAGGHGVTRVDYKIEYGCAELREINEKLWKLGSGLNTPRMFNPALYSKNSSKLNDA